MMRIYHAIILLCFFFSCKRDPKIPLQVIPQTECTDGIFSVRGSSDFDYIKSNLLSTSVFGSTLFRQDPNLFTTPCFNPLNNYEICYIKDLSSSSTGKELWKYDICRNNKTIITNKIFYNVDWSTKNWIIFTSSDQHVYKIKPNGDSLTKLTFDSGIHAVGKWSPNGKNFWYKNGGTLYILCDENGVISDTITSNVYILDWLSDSTLLVNLNQYFCSYNLSDHSISLPLHSSPFYNFGFQYYNKTKNSCIVSSNAGQNPYPKYLLNYDFNANKIDTIKQLYYSYQFIKGDVNQKGNNSVFELRRAEWKDSLLDFINYRNNIIISNEFGENERLLNLN